MHVTESVFIRRYAVSDADAVYELWSRDFGKIRAFASEKKTGAKLDTGSLVQASIETKGNRNRLVSFKLRRNLNFERLGYRNVLSFLKTVQSISKALPDGTPAMKLFDEFSACHGRFEDPDVAEKAGILFRFKFARTLGTFSIPDRASESLRRLDRAAAAYPLADLLSIGGISEELLAEADAAAETAFLRYHS